MNDELKDFFSKVSLEKKKIKLKEIEEQKKEDEYLSGLVKKPDLSNFFSSLAEEKRRIQEQNKLDKKKLDLLEDLLYSRSEKEEEKPILVVPPIVEEIIVEPKEEVIEEPKIVEEDTKELVIEELNKISKNTGIEFNEQVKDIDGLKVEFKRFKDLVTRQLGSIGGGGAVNIRDMDDVASSAFVEGKALIYQASTGKFIGGESGSATSRLGSSDIIDFSLDATNTSILLSNGDSFGVNTIIAVANSDNHIDIKTHTNNVIKIEDLRLDKAKINTTLVTQTLATAVNELNSLFSGSGQGLIDTTNYRYQRTNATMSATQDYSLGPVFFGTQLQKGDEIIFTCPSAATHVGLWGGGDGTSDPERKTNWTHKWWFDGTNIKGVNTDVKSSIGVQLGKDVPLATSGTYAVRWGHTSNRLELHEIKEGYSWHIDTANSELVSGTTDIYIHFTRENDGSLPTVSEVRPSEWKLINTTLASRNVETNIRDGFSSDDVYKNRRGFVQGTKLVFQSKAQHKNSYWGSQWNHAISLGNGTADPLGDIVNAWRYSAGEQLKEDRNSSVNPNYTFVDGNGSASIPSGRTFSWRYHTDNSWDIFDEDIEDVVITGDDPITSDGSTVFHTVIIQATDTDINDISLIDNTYDWNAKLWFFEHRDDFIGISADNGLRSYANAYPLTRFSSINSDDYLRDAEDKMTWGEHMRPGSEFIWTQLQDTTNDNSHNMVIGVLNDSDKTQFLAGLRFYGSRSGQSGAVQAKEQSLQDQGFTVHNSTIDTRGKSMRLRYEFGTNKLKCEVVHNGVRTLIGESTNALNGEPVYITIGGFSTKMPTAQGVEVYGWSFRHKATGHYNPWEVWRQDTFPETKVDEINGSGTSNKNTIKAKSVLEHKDGLAPGHKMVWNQGFSYESRINIGQVNSNMPASGEASPFNVQYWHWQFSFNTGEDIDTLHNMSFNTSNSNFANSKWNGTGPSKEISIRYSSSNVITLHDEAEDEVILTGPTLDGSVVKIGYTYRTDIINSTQQADEFMGGGDVTISAI
tara:strand:- start:311 stop:3391 length:3081 start_codon:yes stop_codon:yes gene_type:complete